MKRTLFAAVLAAILCFQAQAEEQSLQFTVKLPADAKLVIQGYTTKSTGKSRRFETPPVTIGQEYTYSINASHNGKSITKTITLAFGGANDFDLTNDFEKVSVREAGPYDKPGFVTFQKDGRLWIYKTGSKELQDHEQNGPSDKHSTRINAGPNGMTLKAPDDGTILDYLTTTKGYVTKWEDGRLWVFQEGSEGLKESESQGPPEKHAMRINASKLGITIKAPDEQTIDGYLVASGLKAEVIETGPDLGTPITTPKTSSHDKPGFVTFEKDGRLWIYRADSKELANHRANGPSDKHVMRINAGPQGMTLKAPDDKTILDYLATTKGYVTKWDEDRLWVFKEGSEVLKELDKQGPPEKHATRINAGTIGLTIKAEDNETIDAYLKASGLGGE